MIHKCSSFAFQKIRHVASLTMSLNDKSYCPLKSTSHNVSKHFNGMSYMLMIPNDSLVMLH